MYLALVEGKRLKGEGIEVKLGQNGLAIASDQRTRGIAVVLSRGGRGYYHRLLLVITSSRVPGGRPLSLRQTGSS